MHNSVKLSILVSNSSMRKVIDELHHAHPGTKKKIQELIRSLLIFNMVLFYFSPFSDADGDHERANTRDEVHRPEQTKG